MEAVKVVAIRMLTRSVTFAFAHVGYHVLVAHEGEVGLDGGNINLRRIEPGCVQDVPPPVVPDRQLSGDRAPILQPFAHLGVLRVGERMAKLASAVVVAPFNEDVRLRPYVFRREKREVVGVGLDEHVRVFLCDATCDFVDEIQEQAALRALPLGYRLARPAQAEMRGIVVLANFDDFRWD